MRLDAIVVGKVTRQDFTYCTETPWGAHISWCHKSVCLDSWGAGGTRSRGCLRRRSWCVGWYVFRWWIRGCCKVSKDFRWCLRWVGMSCWNFWFCSSFAFLVCWRSLMRHWNGGRMLELYRLKDDDVKKRNLVGPVRRCPVYLTLDRESLERNEWVWERWQYEIRSSTQRKWQRLKTLR